MGFHKAQRPQCSGRVDLTKRDLNNLHMVFEKRTFLNPKIENLASTGFIYSGVIPKRAAPKFVNFSRVIVFSIYSGRSA